MQLHWDGVLKALDELARHRGASPSAFEYEVARALLHGVNKALSDSEQGHKVWRAIAAPTGGGKTTGALACMAAHLQRGGSSLFLTETKVEADRAFRELHELCPGQVAIRTSDHDLDLLESRGDGYRQKTIDESGYQPAMFFRLSELSNFKGLVGTHQSYKQRPGQMLKLVDGARRDLTIVDERANDIDVVQLRLSELLALSEAMQQRVGLDSVGEEPVLTQAFGDAANQFRSMHFERSRRFHKLSYEASPEQIAQLRLLVRSGPVRARLAARMGVDVDELTSAAKLLLGALPQAATAFVHLDVRFSSGGETYVAFAPSWPLRPGTLLLDATSEIDDYAELSSARVLEPSPRASYPHLESVSLQGPAYLTAHSFKKTWLKHSRRAPLLSWMHKCIIESTQPGEKVLIVSWKAILEDNTFRSKDWQGRDVSFCHFGSGIGSNQWRDCTTVLIFGDYYMPSTVTVASTHALQGTGFVDSDSAGARLSGNYRLAQVGVLLRWFKQLSMRGCARRLDSAGISAPMKLCFCSKEPDVLIENWQVMFPDASAPTPRFVDDEQPAAARPRSRVSSIPSLVRAFLSTTKDTRVSAEALEHATGVAMREVSRRYNSNSDGLRDWCESNGWTLVPGRGRHNRSAFQNRSS